MGRRKKSLPPVRARVGLTRGKEARLKIRLRKRSPSEPWVEAQIVSVIDVDPDGDAIHYRYHDTTVFPPGGADTLMIRCPRCGVYTPPNATEHGKCLDHARHKGWGPSPSAEAIRSLIYYHGTEEPGVVLEPEDEASLLREIEAWKLEHPESEGNSALA